MNFPKILFVGSIVLFGVIGITAIVKKEKKPALQSAAPMQAAPRIGATTYAAPPVASQPLDLEGDFPSIDRIHQLFTKGSTKLPIVETVTYSSKVPWLKGRPAWISDYAAFYGTSRHFIARALSGKPDYFNQRVSEGNQFNVFRKDKNFQFYLLVDASLCKMGFYYVDLDTNERVLLKTYRVGLGKEGVLPLGRYTLGDRVAIYRPGVTDFFRDKQVEMVRVFGTRWIPFSQGKGLGIHGVPWQQDSSGQFMEKSEMLGQYDSDGSILLKNDDVEELFSIVITKPTIVEIVKNFKDANLPGVEVASPKRPA
jgi:hypothetical protein